MSKNPLVKKYGSEARWVTWKFQVRKGKSTKVPHTIMGDLASSTNPDDWSTYEEVKNFADVTGIIFTPEQKLLGIDIDHIIEKDGSVPDHIQKFIDLCDTYTEISPSGTGLHLYLDVTESFPLEANKKAPFELYTKGRYFTVTEKSFGKAKEVRTVTPEEANKILASIGYPWKEEDEEESDQQTLAVVNNKQPIVNTIVNLNDDEVLAKMFASEKNGAKAKSLYDGAADIKDKSSADLALCSFLAFYTRKDSTQMERIWLSSPLGSRKKTQKRKDYREATIEKAIKGCKEVYEPSAKVKTEKLNDQLDLDLLFTYYKDTKVYTQNTENMCRILRKHPEFAGTLRYDAFKNVIEIKVNGKWRTVEDNDAVNLQTQIQILFSYFGKVGKDMVYDALIKVAKENTMDSAIDYITSIKWDGVARLDNWLTHVYGVPEDLYHKAVGSNWLKGLVKRIVEPGCKFDYVLVLEGEQGTRKSTSLHILGGDWHVETAMSTDSKDFFMQFAGKAIIEFSEGETLNRTEVKRMKAIITMQSDKYRPPYERSSQDFPRRCVFAMTTNQTEYLKDETGNRRWLPITVALPEANIDWLKDNRDQLYAEAYHRVHNLKETIYEFPKEETRAAQEARRIREPNTDLVVDWYFNKLSKDKREDGITVNQVYRDAFHGGYPSKPLDRYNEMNIADILKTSLKLTKRRVMYNGVQSIRWYNTAGLSKEEVEKIIHIMSVDREDDETEDEDW